MTTELLSRYKQYFKQSDKYSEEFKYDMAEIIELAKAQLYDHEIRRMQKQHLHKNEV